MKKYILLIVISLFIANFFIYLKTEYDPIADKYRYSKVSLGGDLNENLGEITSELVIDQSFMAESDNISGINIFFSTFNRVNTGKTILRILDVNKSNVLRTITLNNDEIKDNQYLNLTFDPIKETKNKIFILSISATTSAAIGDGITVWRDFNQSINTKLSVNNETLDGTIVADITYEYKIDGYKKVILNLVVLILNFLTLKLFLFLKNR